MAKQQNEFWTSYFSDRLKEEKLRFDRNQVSDRSDFYLDFLLSDEIKICLGLSIEESKATPTHATNLVEMLHQIGREKVYINYPLEGKDYYIEFNFLPDDKAKCIVDSELIITGRLSKYENGKIYDAEEVIEDLVNMAKNPTSSIFELKPAQSRKEREISPRLLQTLE